MSRRAVYLVVIRRPLDDETLRSLVEELRQHQLHAEIREVKSRHRTCDHLSEPDAQ